MINFVIIYIVLCGLYLIDKNIKSINIIGHVLIYIIASLIASSLVGFRPLDAGFDTEPYVLFYESLEGVSFNNLNSVYAYNFQTDYFYIYWNYFISKLGFNSSEFLYITAVISVFFVLIAFKKLFKSESLLVFIALYSTPGFVMFFGNAMRQGLALPVFILAIYCFLNRKYFLSGVLILITSLFHKYTGVILAITLFLSLFSFKLIENRKLLLLLVLILLQPIILLLQNIIFSIYPSVYLTMGGYEYFYHYSYIVFLLLYIIYSFKLKINNQKIKNMFNIYTILSIITSSLWFNPTAFGRVLYLVYPFMLFFIIYMFSFIKERRLKYVLLIIFLFVGIYFFITDSTQITLN